MVLRFAITELSSSVLADMDFYIQRITSLLWHSTDKYPF